MFNLLPFLFLAPAPVEVKPEFIKVIYENKKAVSLKTSIVRYENGKGQNVDLVSAIHVGDRMYYLNLNKVFKNYDVVCYELVAPKGTRVKEKKENVIGMMQKIMKNFLLLEHQLDLIDYQAKNFVHADLSFEEMEKIINSRGDNQLTIILKVLAEQIQKQNLNQDKQPNIENVFNPFSIKRFMAESLTTSGMDIGPTLNQILVKDRNKAAMGEVEKQLKTHKSVAIFYGCAHNNDLSERLNKLGFKPKSVQWLTAWDMQITPQEAFFEALKSLIDE